MRSLFIALVSIASLLAADRTTASEQTTSGSSPVPKHSRQLLLVRAAHWYSSSGSLERYERKNHEWQQVGTSISVKLGRNGLGWGRGLHTATEPGPVKREGDGRSPAGAFALGTAFGALANLPEGARDFPYLQTADSTYCVEDVRSEHYNQIIDAKGVKPNTWQRWSQMKRSDGLFNWGVVVRQNEPEPKKGAGSCVFLHIWRSQREPTSGCTAMATENIEAVLRWLDAEQKPILVQLPEQAFQKLRRDWLLP